MKHFLYKTTNKLNQRFYIGMHSTNNQDDGYLGSGKRIKAEIGKYGKENFEKVILEELPTRQALEDREREVVNEELMKDPLCLNLKNGGEGGGKFSSKEHQMKCSSAGGKIGGKISGPLLGKKYGNNIFKTREKILATGKTGTFEGFTHSEESRKKIGLANSLAQAGEKNSQFGSCWVIKDEKPIKIRKEQLTEYLENGYSAGRKSRPTPGNRSRNVE